MPDKKTQAYRPLYCIVTMPADPSQLKPDMGTYSPKELAAKEKVSTTNVYSWIEQGLPVMRRGDKGNILIHYQDYIQWMIDCAYNERKVRDIPSWAFRFVKSTEPKRTPNPKPAQVQQKAPSVAVSAQNPSKGAENAEKACKPPKNAQKNAENGQLSLFALPGFVA
jgi:hypothetical protein